MIDLWGWLVNHEVLFHEVFLMTLGLGLWYAISWKRFKTPFDKRHEKASFKQWRQEESDDIILSLLVGCVLIMLDDEILEALNMEGEKFHDAVYLTGGPVADMLYEGAEWFDKNKKNILNWIVKKFKS